MRGSPLTISTMRDIKFRAFDKIVNEILPNIQNHINDKDFAFGQMLSNVKRFKIMQFTGLTDKKGVEIYEGDIVKSVGNEEHNGMVGIFPIEFNKGMFSLSYQTIRLDYFLEYYKIEVIGNIYQNPELIK